MSPHSAGAVVRVELPRVEERLDDVEWWPAFLTEVQTLRRVARERYEVQLTDGRTALIWLGWEPEHRRYRWQSLRGPEFQGQISLVPAGSSHTLITMEVHLEPRGLVALAADMLVPRAEAAEIDLARLAEELAAPA